jgi:methanogenic corrinoid protein MtbC1
MRPRVDAQVASVLLAEGPAVVEEVLAASGPLRARRDQGRLACDSEFGSHVRALAASVDLRAPSVFRAHASWAEQVHQSSGLPEGGVAACFRALARRVQGLALPPEEKVWLAEALQAGVEAAEEVYLDFQLELEGAARAALCGDRHSFLAEVAAWREERGPRGALLGIARVQRATGEAWMRHQVTVVEEHRATELAGLALATLAPGTWGAPGQRHRGAAILAAAPGDFHVAGIHLAAHLLELEGFSVEVLGADTPAVQLAVATVERKPVLVGIGVAAIDHLPAAREAAAMVRHAGPQARIVVGGFAARAAGAPALGADFLVPEIFDGRIGATPGAPGAGGVDDAMR